MKNENRQLDFGMGNIGLYQDLIHSLWITSVTHLFFNPLISFVENIMLYLEIQFLTLVKGTTCVTE
jgi:hypothetical protein